ncbi:MAG: type I DNA topoisomerase [Alphaproteobacteria bacterium]
MPANKLVIVESPSKARTINKYLGKDFYVIASMGHIRDLAKTSGSVNPDNNFSMTWSVSPKGNIQIKNIIDAITPHTSLYLATDPDREGEAISWHLTEELIRRKKMPNTTPQRIIFHEITEQAIMEAMAQPRHLNKNLIAAYLARRALDYLVGYSLSPILWRKLPGSRSAGRVQSTALRLLVEREIEIKNFQPNEYWSLDTNLLTIGENENSPNICLNAFLSHQNGKRLERLAIKNKEMATKYKTQIQNAKIILQKLDNKEIHRHPAPPFITSTLQQEANHKLGFNASYTMKIAQQLYEGIRLGNTTVGLISYMRTDSTQLSGSAIAAARHYIQKHYSQNYLPPSPRQYKTKSKNAQEAHEAIRPTNINRTPNDVARYLRPEQLLLYKLIWRRTLASQMASAILNQTTAHFAVNDNALTLTANGQTILFDGFLKLYQTGKDDATDKKSNHIPPLKLNAPALINTIDLTQHFTEPPPRYNEASLIKKMEDIGIGRPSTYANIIKILQDREYVRQDKKKFFCENRGIILSTFLTRYYNEYFNYDFTAKMEDDLDEVANGKYDWQELLHHFWQNFTKKLSNSDNLLHADIQTEIQTILHNFIFGDDTIKDKNQKCQKCTNGKLNLQLGKFGPYLSCSNYPNCDYRADFENQTTTQQPIETIDGMILPKLLGQDENGRNINIKKGPYGLYIEQALDMINHQTPQNKKSKKPKPKRIAIPKTYKPSNINLSIAIKLLSLPRTIGTDPHSQKNIIGAIGPYGAYLKMGEDYYSLKKHDNILDIDLNRAIDIIANAPKKRTKQRIIGEHPDGGNIIIKLGRWGYYLEWQKIGKQGKTHKKFAKLAAGTDAKNFTLDLALILFPPTKNKKMAMTNIPTPA